VPRVEDAEIFHVLEKSTDSDVTIFSSEEDKDCNEPNRDEDWQLDGNSETNEDGGTPTSGPQTHLKWTNTLNFKELEKYENWPTEFRKPTVLKLKRGESRKMQHDDVTAVVWQDKRVVLLSTNSDPRTDGSVKRKTGKGNEETEIACPQAVINYMKHMGGVDVSDQKREYYGVGQS